MRATKQACHEGFVSKAPEEEVVAKEREKEPAGNSERLQKLLAEMQE